MTHYARAGGVHIAYQVFGAGPNVVVVPEWASHVEVQWEEPRIARFLDALGSFSRVVTFDKRGVGLSDPVALDDLPTLDEWMDDVGAVLDDAKVREAAVIGIGSGGPMSVLFAATHPERVRALVLIGTYPRMMRAPDFPMGVPPESMTEIVEWTSEQWGTGSTFGVAAPSLRGDAVARAFHSRLQRMSVSPGAGARMQAMVLGIDVRSVLPSLQVPTLVLHRAGDRIVNIEHGRFLAAHIPGARLVELPGEDHAFYVGDTRSVLDEIEEFLTGTRAGVEPDRVLATVLFTDIVESTRTAAAIGDAEWRDLVDRHDAIVRAQLARYRGDEIHTAGDGFLVAFDGPARAIRCACAIRDAVQALGLEIRAGVHTGEVDRRGTNLTGLAVHIGARVSALAAPSEVLVSRTVVDLVAGSGIAFADRGVTTLRGVPGEWQLHAVISC